jgi:DNA-binding transcriptional LysR family regulator
MRQPIMIALPPGHPLAKRSRVPLQALSGEPQIMFARSNAPRFFDAVLAACREAGFSMNIAHEVDNLYTACALVAAGLGVCLVPSGVQDSHASSPMVVRPVTPALPHTDMHIALAYKVNSTSDLVPLFVSVVREVVAKHGTLKARSA